jgi:nitroreductase
MTDHLGLTADGVLTTTRSVRRRLDLSRAVPREVVIECLEIAHQAPAASNQMLWRWMMIDDDATKQAIAAMYLRNFEAYAVSSAAAKDNKVLDSARYLAENMGRVPLLVLPLVEGRLDEATPITRQASRWGSIVPAMWSFMLALRERGLGSALTTLHLHSEREVADLVGIPFDAYTQAALLPVAYTMGTDFRLAKRPPADTFVHWNRWSS